MDVNTNRAGRMALFARRSGGAAGHHDPRRAAGRASLWLSATFRYCECTVMVKTRRNP
jgi:hypothetical protein